MTVYIVGRGAIGTALAAQWKEAGCEVVFLCDGERKRRYADSDLLVNGRKTRFIYSEPGDLPGDPGVVFLAVKYHQLPSVYPLLDRIGSGKTVFVSLLNGIDSEQMLAGRYGWDRVVNAFVNRIDATFTGNNLSFSVRGVVVFGDRTGENPGNAEKVRALLEAGKIEHSLEEDILSAQWLKFMINIGMNQVSALLGAPYRAFQDNAHIQTVAREAMEEAISVARGLDISIPPGSIDEVFSMISGYSLDGKTSMLQDVDARRKTEVDMLSGVLCRLGEELSIPTPVNRVLFHSLKFLESRYLH